MTDAQPPSSDAPSKLAPTREDLAARLAAAQEREATNMRAQERRRGQASGVNLGMRIGIELIASVLVGGGLGWYADEKLHTKPIFLLALLCLGFTAGVMNVIRIAKGLDHAGGLDRPEAKNDVAAAPVSAEDDDDD